MSFVGAFGTAVRRAFRVSIAAVAAGAAVVGTGLSRAGGKNHLSYILAFPGLLRGAMDVRSKTQGRANFTMQFDHYERVPAQIAEEIVSKRS